MKLINLLRKKRFASNASYEKYRPKGFKGPLQYTSYPLNNSTCLISFQASKENFVPGSIMHNKFFIADNKTVWSGSTNVSGSGTGGYNANIAVVINSEKVAKIYTDEFELMHKDGKFHETKITKDYYEKTPSDVMKIKSQTFSIDQDTALDITFSPQGNGMELIKKLIDGANKQIDVAIFYLTHRALTGNLIKARQRDIKIRVITDATSASNNYTKHELLRAAGIPVKVENWGGKMHMKTAIIDSKHVVAGSMNWTSAGQYTNDENIIIIHSDTIAKQVGKYFEEIWNSIDSRWLTENPAAESLDSKTACFDGIDNDFDGLIDGDDLDCSNNPPKQKSPQPYFIVKKIALRRMDY